MAKRKVRDPDKPITDIADLPLKQLAFKLLKDNGVNNDDASDAVGYKPQTGRVVSSKINKMIFSDSKMVKSAVKVLKNCMDGNTWGSIQKIKDSTALSAAQMVADRYEPAIKQTQNLNVNIDVSPVDLNEFRLK